MDGSAAMRCVLLDDRGESWEAGSSRLADTLQSSIRGDALVDYAVRNLGFVAVSESDSAARIRLRPAVVSPIAFSALVYWLHDNPRRRLVLSFLDDDWSHEVVGGCNEAVRKLLARVKPDTQERHGDFLDKSLPLHDLPASSPLRAALTVWSDCSGRYDRERLHPLMERALKGRFVLVESAEGASNLTIKDIGCGLTKPAEYWLSRSIGLRVEDQPDCAFGEWVAQSYRRVFSTGQPDLGDVDAIIRWPQQGRKNFRYRRLLLPFRADDGSALLLGATLVDQGINLRVKGGHETLNASEKLVGVHPHQSAANGL
jgi:hypothetical protein